MLTYVLRTAYDPRQHESNKFVANLTIRTIERQESAAVAGQRLARFDCSWRSYQVGLQRSRYKRLNLVSTLNSTSNFASVPDEY